jgi:SHS2 domain-containing protein
LNLKKALSELNTNEIKLIVNPLRCTPEMTNWAYKIILGATNDEQKAKMIFEVLVNRARKGDPSRVGEIRTASEVFNNWENPKSSFCCKDYALLYISLARAVGIQAVDVYVEEEADGRKEPHDCAFIFLGTKGFLVDPSYLSFGVAHRRFEILNDINAIALYMSQLPNLEDSRIACKLSPHLQLVQLNLFEKLLDYDRLDEAREVSRIITNLDKSLITYDYLEADMAVHEYNSEVAARFLTNAIGIDSDVGTYHALMANVYAQEGDVDRTRSALQRALLCPITQEEAVNITKFISDTNELSNWVNVQHNLAQKFKHK